MDILKESKKYMLRIAEADRKAADMRARAAEMEKELAFPLSAGVARMEPGRAKGQHKSSVEAEAVKRERQRERIAALRNEAEQMQQERAYVVAFMEALRRLKKYSMAHVIECRYLQGLTIKETARATFWKEADVKQLEEQGLLSIANVFLGLREPGGVYDRDGLYLMSLEEQEKLLRKWGGP